MTGVAAAARAKKESAQSAAKLAATFPPLTDTQIARIAALLSAAPARIQETP